MFSKLKQYRDMRKQAKTVESKLAGEMVEGKALGDKVIVKMTGTQEIEAVTIDPSLLAVDQKETLEKGIADAFKNANKNMRSMMMKKIQAGEIEMPKW